MNTLALPWAKTGQEQPDVGGGGRQAPVAVARLG